MIENLEVMPRKFFLNKRKIGFVTMLFALISVVSIYLILHPELLMTGLPRVKKPKGKYSR